ncbi:fungal specific transcription factor domain-containing protein [Aspergillus mulundensis]|uniref:Putative Zn(II)2Cys6 transcription factor n=1 Tax=Aspergillus mulundensis TaxID=1810919 RepID=A0A3D8RYY7_9EURO|nr:putative Zn(II)2Cys6 transcription factor [Aspergillus mulundensis]RDW79263.1 putative Zn(II)2Cys6 transcription factor [Aspergillus mulundensis]
MQKNLGIEKSCSMRECSLPASDDTSSSTDLSDAPLLVRRRISLSTYYTYIDIFRSQLYTVWPIVSTNVLKAQLNDIANTESHALAAALCAATLAQLRLPGHTQAQESFLVTSGDFVRECIRLRTDHNPQNSASLESLLTSLFLHMYYANVDQIPLATFALRDAITHAHLLSLGNVELFKDSQEEQQLRLRVYWILLVTERTFCMQHELPITLQTIEDLPVPVDDGDSDPALLTGFCNLVRLFTRIDGPLLQAPYLAPHPTYSRAKITDIQEDLQTRATKDPIIDEVQRVDIWVTLAWLSSLLWQYSASHYMLASDSSNVCLAPSYPFVIARNFLSLVCGASLDSVRPHGYGMEIKLFQLANSLIDVLVYVPSLSKIYSDCEWGPRHAVVELEHLLDIVAGGKSERLDNLHIRMAQIDYTPAPRKALPSSEDDDRELEGSPVIDLTSSPDAEYQWSDGKRELMLQLGPTDMNFSTVFPEFGVGVVSFFPAGGDEPSGYGEAFYECPADFFARGARMPHIPRSSPAGCSRVVFET